MNRDHRSAQQQDTQPEVALWEFVPVADYRLPRISSTSAAANAWASIKRLLRGGNDEKRAPLKAETDLRTLPHLRLDHLVRALDWESAASALDLALADWIDAAAPETRLRFVVGQPYCGHTQILQHWASRRAAAQVEPPACDQILAGDGRWLEQCLAHDRLWVLPNLEHCFLRHANGLTLVRRLLEHVAGAASGRAVIGCDSWAWAYLKRVWPVPQANALTLQAFDGARLSRCFAAMIPAQPSGRLQFRDARSGKPVLCVPPQTDDEVGPQIDDLAARCRGNVGTARWYWRERLRSEPEPDDDGSDRIEPPKDGAKPHAETIWVSAGVDDPHIPEGEDDETVLVLHALLLHGGLPAAVLPDVLALPRYRIMASLLLLKACGVVQLQDERWTVSALGYAAVRETLRTRGYLTDDF